MNIIPRMSTTLMRTTRCLRQCTLLPVALTSHQASHRTPRSRPALLACAYTFAAATAFRCGHATLSEFATSSAAVGAVGVEAQSTPEIVLYQYEVCPFCNKVRAYLDYHDVKYSVVEVDPLRKTELKVLDDKEYRKVPIAIVDGEQVNGSGSVIDKVGAMIGDDGASEMERRWVQWLDETLIHLIAPNIYRTMGESLQTFQYITENAKFSAWQKGTIRYSGAAAMYMVGRKMKKKYGIADERQAFVDALGEWTNAIEEQGGKFLGGNKPGMADLSVYGVLKAIQTFDTFTELRQRNVRFGEWFDRMKEAVGDEAIVSRS